MTISSRERGRPVPPREDVTSPATKREEQVDLPREEQALTEEARRRAERYAEKLAAALRDGGATR